MPFKVGTRGINLRTEQTIVEKIRDVEAETCYNLNLLKWFDPQQPGMDILLIVLSCFPDGDNFGIRSFLLSVLMVFTMDQDSKLQCHWKSLSDGSASSVCLPSSRSSRELHVSFRCVSPEDIGTLLSL